MRLRANWVAILSIAALVGLFTYSLVHLLRINAEFRNELGESNLWIMTQAEREAQSLLLTLDRYQEDQSYQDVLLRLDILFSRIVLLSEPPQTKYLASIGMAQQLRDIQANLATLDTILTDQPASESAAILAAEGELRAMAGALRQITNVTFLSERTARIEKRQVQSRVMGILITASVGIFLLGLLMAVLMWRNLGRALEAQQALERHRAALEVTIAARTSELREALEVERRANEVYQSFIVTVSHQFRTPVSIIHMITQRLLRREDLEEGLRGKLQRVYDAAERLELLLSGFLASASSHKSDQIARNPVDLRQVVASAVGQVAATTPERILSVDLTEAPLPLTGDSILLEQAVLNLLTNALKYSEAPRPVQVILTRERGQAVLKVMDRGIGIPPEASHAIFDRFFRAANVHNVQGAGVGLAFSREAIALHGGVINFNPRAGGGTEFTVTLPLAGEQRVTDQPSDDPLHRG